MLLKTLFENIDAKFPTKIDMEHDIRGITCDTRDIDEDFIFVAIKGGRDDGHNHIKEAFDSGASYVVCEQDMGVKNQIIVPNTRAVYALLCGNINGNPAKDMKLIGVTGTNGKTTVSNLISYLLKHAGYNTGLISTIDIKMGDFSVPSKYTTPDSAQLHSILKQMKKVGCEYVVIETSSHALDQHRLEGLEFERGIFMNLTSEHLDYHGTMEEYFFAKAKLFDMSKRGIINIGDEYGESLCESLEDGTYTTFAIENAKDEILADFLVKSENIVDEASGVEYDLICKEDINHVALNMPGVFSVENSLAAIACVCDMGVPMEKAIEGLKEYAGVKGRCEVIDTNLNFTIIRDFAHAPDGLDNILSTISGFAKKRIITVFGCPGERDTTKRKKMGKVVAKRSDVIVVTSDNPRSEDEMKIIQEALDGVQSENKPYYFNTDRVSAIKWAMLEAKKDDIVLLAGKGHEDYQVLSYGSIAFDERKIVEQIASEMEVV